MDFSVITPSFRHSALLKRCVASVSDQQCVTLEHIVQDAGSDDGTLDWLPKDKRVRAFVEKDDGMYDAINRGLRRASGDLLAYLNCDEQYLMGALAAVKEFFAKHPEVEVLFADAVVVDGAGKFMAYRKAVLPRRAHVQVCHLPTFTCSTFFRRSLLDRHQLFFDPQWRVAGDAAWVLKMFGQGVRMSVFRRYTSAFTQTGRNLGASPAALSEKARLRSLAPLWMRALEPFWMVRHRLAKWREGCYRQESFEYSIYTTGCVDGRTKFVVTEPGFRLKAGPQSGR